MEGQRIGFAKGKTVLLEGVNMCADNLIVGRHAVVVDTALRQIGIQFRHIFSGKVGDRQAVFIIVIHGGLHIRRGKDFAVFTFYRLHALYGK